MFEGRNNRIELQPTRGRDMSEEPAGREYNVKVDRGETPEPVVRETETHLEAFRTIPAYGRALSMLDAVFGEVLLSATELPNREALQVYDEPTPAFVNHSTDMTVSGTSALSHEPMTPDGRPAFSASATGKVEQVILPTDIQGAQ